MYRLLQYMVHCHIAFSYQSEAYLLYVMVDDVRQQFCCHYRTMRNRQWMPVLRSQLHPSHVNCQSSTCHEYESILLITVLVS
jgi:hypothetical protein